MKRIHHFRRPEEVPFTASERDRVTLLLGGLTWKHERLIQALLERQGCRAECLPQPDREAHEIGKEYCASGLCNPVYFTVGNLIRRLRELERDGLSPEQIAADYLYFTAGSGGPCRFGMYESEFRSALAAAGYPGFRVILFMQEEGARASSGQSGLPFSIDFGMCTLHAFVLGDLLNELHRKLTPYETVPGEAYRLVATLTERLANYFKKGPFFDLEEAAPKPLQGFLRRHRSSIVFRISNTTGKILTHLYGPGLTGELKECRDLIAKMELDRLRVKPVVKVIGEFWAQMTEGDGNFRMFEFLEKEGAEVGIESISCWILYLLHQARQRQNVELRLAAREHPWTRPLPALKARLRILPKRFLFSLSDRIYRKHYERLAQALGGINTPPTPQTKLAATAAPHYCTMLRGGEGHLEVGKSVYYTKQRSCHLVLALKPFGCIPSTQSDAVQAALTEKIPEMAFLSIETAVEGEIHAYSRVQMALAEARSFARSEFEQALNTTRLSLDEVRDFIEANPQIRSPLYHIPRHPGVITLAANVVLHVGALLGRPVVASYPAQPRTNTYSESIPMRGMASQQETTNV